MNTNKAKHRITKLDADLWEAVEVIAPGVEMFGCGATRAEALAALAKARTAYTMAHYQSMAAAVARA